MIDSIDITEDEELDEPEVYEWVEECACCDDLDEWYPEEEDELDGESM